MDYDDEEFIYKQIAKISPLSSMYTVNSLIKIDKETFIASGGDGTIGIYKYTESGLKQKQLTKLDSSYYLLKLSDNRFLNCELDDGMTIFSIDFEKEECKIEQKIPIENDCVPMCIELSNGKLISAGNYKGSLSLWEKKDKNYILIKKKEKIIGEDGICLFEVSDKEIVVISTNHKLLFIDSNTLEINSKIENINSPVSNTSSICKISENIIAVGGAYGSGIYLIDIKNKKLVNNIKLEKEKDINCIFKLKNGIILTAEYYTSPGGGNNDDSDDSESGKEMVDITQWKFDEKNNILIECDVNDNVDVASIRSIIEWDNGDFITGSLSGMIRIWHKSGEVVYM